MVEDARHAFNHIDEGPAVTRTYAPARSSTAVSLGSKSYELALLAKDILYEQQMIGWAYDWMHEVIRLPSPR